uniref:3'-phosphoadenosine 5'-phosphosulfate sulfotransferase (PAPS reductase)/FAD synthetase n=1 Tax=Candidatus Kentrum sp. TC TaxID=2126339 RepID=A0A451A1K7_9GAMM|nr:MAG: hypothetical protein BECKTC1821F_GA0114240_103827 [Candidatus Kentron sp. TC]
MRTQIWSCGGGVQSTAIAALILTGEIPKPEHAIIIDTTRERSSTWDYLYAYTAPALREVGVHIARISSAQYANTDLFENSRLLIPAFKRHGTGGKGKLPGHCSSRWKERVAQRWAREKGIERADVWIGISLDEFGRRRESNLKWWRYSYPLIDRRLSRNDCHAIIAGMGWPQPQKSSCWMCPHMRPEEWAYLLDVYPDDFEQAARLDEAMRETKPDAYLTSVCAPLSECRFGEQGCLDLAGCASGFCFA